MLPLPNVTRGRTCRETIEGTSFAPFMVTRGDEQLSVGSRARARTWDRPRNLSIFSCWSTTSPDLTERRSWRCPEALQGVPAGLNIRVVLKRPTEVLDGFLASAQRLEDVASWWGTLLARRCSRR